MPENPPRRRVPLPARLLGTGARGAEAVARAAGLDQAIETAAEEAVVRVAESQAFDQAVERVMRGPAVEEAVAAALRSPAVERALEEALDSEMVDRLWARLLASDEAQKLVERIAEAPEIRNAIASQGVGFIEDLGRGAQNLARRLDDGVESVVRRILRRPRREQGKDCAGVVTRLLAIALDGALLNLTLLALSALLVQLVDALTRGSNPAADGITLVVGAGAWASAAAVYLVSFWALVGRTPGMRFLGITLHDFDDDRRIGVHAAVRRLVWLVIGVLFFGIGILRVVTDERRRGWQDTHAGTEVRYDDDGPRAAPHAQRPEEMGA